MESSEQEPGVVIRGRTARLRPDLVPLFALAAAVLCAAGGWYLLKELAPLLRPLILAVFLAYTILPARRAWRQRVPAKLAGPLLALLVAAVVLVLGLIMYGNLVDLRSELPHLTERARGLIERLSAVPAALLQEHDLPVRRLAERRRQDAARRSRSDDEDVRRQ